MSTRLEAFPHGVETTASRSLRWGSVLLVFLVFFVHGGWPVPEVNEAHYLTKAKHYWNPEWCAGDFFLESKDAHQVFYWTIGWMTLYLPLPVVAWVGRIAGWWLLAWGWCRLSLAINPRPLLAPLSAALWVAMTERFNMAGEWVVGGVEAKVFAYGFVFLAMESLLRNRWNRAWLLLGAASAFHVLVGGWATIAAGFCWCLDRRRRPKLLSMAPGLVGGGLLALLGLVPAAILTVGVPSETVSAANEIYVFDRLPHHLAIHTLGHDRIVHRLTNHGILIALLAVFGWLSRWDEDDNRRAAGRDLQYFVWAAVLIALVGGLIAVTTQGNPPLAAKLLRYYWFRLSDVIVPVGAALLGVQCLDLLLRRRPRLGTVALAVTLALAVGHLWDVTWTRLSTITPRCDYPLADYSDRRDAGYSDWRDACRWTVQHTDPDARFITPRVSQTFPWYAGRPEVATYKNIPQDAPSIVAWRERMHDLHQWQGSDPILSYPSLSYRTPEDLIALAQRYGASYLITWDERPLELPLAYRNGTFAIYRFSASDDSPPDQP